MASRLTTIVTEELTDQRIFLSSDEQEALERPVSYENADDLAWDRVRHRRLTFYGALRDRFIREGRPLDVWMAMIAECEATAGGPTLLSQLGRQVLKWSARTSDRGAMFGSFAARTLGLISLLLIAMGAYAWYQGAAVAGIVVVAVGAGLYVLGKHLGRLAAARTTQLTAEFGPEPEPVE